MLDAFQKKVEQAAEEYADLVIKIISHAKSADQLTPEVMEKANDGIRMLNHAACTLERISRIQSANTVGDPNCDYHFSDSLKSVRQSDTESSKITDAIRLCEVIKGVSGGKRPIFEIVMLAYMNGMEAGAAYAKDMTQAATVR